MYAEKPPTPIETPLEMPASPHKAPPEKAATPMSTTKKRHMENSSLSQNQDVRFAWACFKSTRQPVDYKALGQLSGCSKDAARLRFYKFRDVFQDMDSLLENDIPGMKTPRKAGDKPEQGTSRGSASKRKATPSKKKEVPSKKVSLKEESPTVKQEALEALESLEDLPTEVAVKMEDISDEA